MQCKVINTSDAKNPAVYLNGTLLSSDKYTYCEQELSAPMHFVGHAGVYVPVNIAFFNLTLLHGDDLIIVYPKARYEYLIYEAVNVGTVIDLRPDPVEANVPPV